MNRTEAKQDLRQDRFRRRPSRMGERSLNDARPEERVPPIPRPPVKEFEPCPLSGKRIEHIFSAMVHRESGKPVILEALIEQLRNAENLSENQQLMYIGSGTFGVYEEVEENGRKQLVLQRRIVYEDIHHKPDWRRELAPGISRDYTPQPRPLSELYTEEELRSFPKLGASSNANYMPRTS